MEAIKKLLAQHAWVPSQQEIADEMQVAVGSIPGLMDGLERKGWIKRQKRKARTVQLVP